VFCCIKTTGILADRFSATEVGWEGVSGPVRMVEAVREFAASLWRVE